MHDLTTEKFIQVYKAFEEALRSGQKVCYKNGNSLQFVQDITLQMTVTIMGNQKIIDVNPKSLCIVEIK